MRHFPVRTWIVLFSFSSVAFAAVAKVPTKNDHSPSAKRAEAQRQALLIELTGKDENALNDIDLYSEIVAAYQGQDEIGLKSRVQKFVSRFPKSPFADNALYLSGRQSLENRNYPEALRSFDQVLKNYPRSNRVVAAQFAKALAYKKMNLQPQARKVFREIMQKYPGSPESFRADSEMRMLN